MSKIRSISVGAAVSLLGLLAFTGAIVDRFDSRSTTPGSVDVVIGLVGALVAVVGGVVIVLGWRQRPLTPAEEAFWQTTWTAWRSGSLSAISPDYQTAAAGDFKTFLKLSTDVRSPGIRQFINGHTPMVGEFLIGAGHYGAFGRNTSFILTNIRLFIRNKAGSGLDGIALEDLKSAAVKIGWSAEITLIKNNGEALVYRGLSSPPRSNVLCAAITSAKGATRLTSEPTRPIQVSSTRPRMGFATGFSVALAIVSAVVYRVVNPGAGLLGVWIVGCVVGGLVGAASVGLQCFRYRSPAKPNKPDS